METMATTTTTPPPVFRLNSEILAEEGEEAFSGDEYDNYYGSSCCEHSSDREYYSHSDAPVEEDNRAVVAKTVGRGPIFDQSQDLPSKIVAMAEFMLSDEHLCRDGFLLKHLRHRQDGYISLKLIASLRKVKRVCKDYDTVAQALKGSEKLEISPDGSKIRRREPISPTLTVITKPKTVGDNEDDGDSDDNPSKQGKEKRRRPQKKGKENKQQQQYGSGGDIRRNSNPRSRSGSGSISMHQNLLWPGFGFDDITPRRRVASFSNTTPTPNPRANNKQQNNQPNNNNQRSHGNNSHFLSPNPIIAALAKDGGADGFWRPKSNSYSEGSQGSKAGMSSWLEKRKASAASLKMSSGDLSQNEVIRQPRGPDGTQGFHPQCRTLNPTMFTLVNHGAICPPPPLIMAH
jgi:hypothetical protein